MKAMPGASAGHKRAGVHEASVDDVSSSPNVGEVGRCLLSSTLLGSNAGIKATFEHFVHSHKPSIDASADTAECMEDILEGQSILNSDEDAEGRETRALVGASEDSHANSDVGKGWSSGDSFKQEEARRKDVLDLDRCNLDNVARLLAELVHIKQSSTGRKDGDRQHNEGASGHNSPTQATATAATTATIKPNSDPTLNQSADCSTPTASLADPSTNELLIEPERMDSDGVDHLEALHKEQQRFAVLARDHPQLLIAKLHQLRAQNARLESKLICKSLAGTRSTHVTNGETGMPRSRPAHPTQQHEHEADSQQGDAVQRLLSRALSAHAHQQQQQHQHTAKREVSVQQAPETALSSGHTSPSRSVTTPASVGVVARWRAPYESGYDSDSTSIASSECNHRTVGDRRAALARRVQRHGTAVLCQCGANGSTCGGSCGCELIDLDVNDTERAVEVLDLPRESILALLSISSPPALPSHSPSVSTTSTSCGTSSPRQTTPLVNASLRVAREPLVEALKALLCSQLGPQ
jgi:hypothetical protein